MSTHALVTLVEAQIDKRIAALQDTALNPLTSGDVRLTACIRRQQLIDVRAILQGTANEL